ncbi:hypothetical protein PoB_002681800 [Plakobranchus ocellatus]|uniref:Uncharacterized protein n=1 Tax=Plakobranchus ocellatus TaxID=259542 RepID=A0AAV4A0Z7_9GAST|nr:hypothetical protein PoB_002681800 [Plakobranchus ocellatus]
MTGASKEEREIRFSDFLQTLNRRNPTVLSLRASHKDHCGVMMVEKRRLRLQVRLSCKRSTSGRRIAGKSSCQGPIGQLRLIPGRLTFQHSVTHTAKKL